MLNSDDIRKPPTITQVACPVCWSDGASSVVVLRDPKTNKVINQSASASNPFILFAILIAGYLLYRVVGENSTWPILLTVLVGAGVFIALRVWGTMRETKAIKVQEYRCGKCGNVWNSGETGA